MLSHVFVELPIDGKPEPFLFDTGTAQTVRRLDGDAGTGVVRRDTPTTLSCRNVRLPFVGPLHVGKMPDGRTVGGVLGTDLIALGGTMDLRVGEGIFVWSSQDLPPLPPGSVSLPATLTSPMNADAESKLVVSEVTLDGKPVRLLVDTGRSHLLLLSKTVRANETEVDGSDGMGGRVKVFRSSIDIAFGGSPARRVTVDRAPAAPALEKVLAAIGDGPIAGVLGIGALGHERILISKDAVRFVP